MANENTPDDEQPQPDSEDETPLDPDDTTSLAARTEALSVLAEFEPRRIPQQLHSVYTEKAFEKCLLCDGILDEDPNGYQIQKSYRRSEVVVEFAICGSCAINLCGEYSEESLRTLERFFLTLFSNLDQEDGRCHACEKSPRNFDNYSAIGICRHEHIVFPVIRLCSDCEEGLHDQLSKKTRDLFGDFFRDNFPTVPEELDLSPLPL